MCDNSEDINALEALDRSWAEAFKSADVERMLAFYHDDAVFFGVGGQTAVGLQEIRKRYQEIIPNLQVISFAFTEAHHQVYGNVACGWMNWHGQWIDRKSGSQIDATGRTTIFYIKKDGLWRAQLDHSSIPAPFGKRGE